MKIRTNSENNIRANRIHIPSQPERLTNYPLYAVPPDCPPYFPAHTYSYSALRPIICPADERKTGAVQALPLAVHLIELPAFSQLGALGK